MGGVFVKEKDSKIWSEIESKGKIIEAGGEDDTQKREEEGKLSE